MSEFISNLMNLLVINFEIPIHIKFESNTICGKKYIFFQMAGRG